MKNGRSYVIFTDVDGCLVDHTTYSFEAAAEALARLKRHGVPLVLCSSKTRAEIERLQQELGTSHPFVSENGGGLFVPPGYFPFELPGARSMAGYDVIELGRPYREVVELLRLAAAKSRVAILGFHDMSVQEVADDCGLPLPAARLAKLREYDEPFRLVEADADGRERLRRAMASAGLRWTVGGRYHHAGGTTDKGVAVALLRRFFRWTQKEVVTVGLGDSPNDIGLLRGVEIPIVVLNRAAGHTAELLQRVPSARVTEAEGPAGWREAVSTLTGA